MYKLESNKAPKAIGPYSQAIVSGKLIFLSGQLGLNRETGDLVEGGVREQTKKAFENIAYILNEEGLDFQSVIKVTVYLKDINDFEAMNEIYTKQFKRPYPARSSFAVMELPKGALIEIEVIAEKYGEIIEL